jgi:Ser/Thr protein kinase RdoA (MazF antagonist)
MKNIPKSILSDIEKQYGLKILNFSTSKLGAANDTYFLKTGGDQYVLRISHAKKPKREVMEEALLLSCFSKDKKIGQHIEPMIANIAGEMVQQCNGYIYCLFHYINGYHPKQLTKDQMRTLVNLIQRIHNFGALNIKQFIGRKSATDPKIILANLKKFNHDMVLNNGQYYTCVEIIENHIKAIKNYPEKTILHQDVWQENILIQKEKMGDLLKLIDFDNYVLGPVILDLAVLIRNFCALESGRKSFDIELAKFIIEQYYFSLSQTLSPALLVKRFISSEFVDILLADLLRFGVDCLNFPNFSKQEKMSLFNDMAYHWIQIIKRDKTVITKELSVFDHSSPSFPIHSSLERLKNTNYYFHLCSILGIYAKPKVLTIPHHSDEQLSNQMIMSKL